MQLLARLLMVFGLVATISAAEPALTVKNGAEAVTFTTAEFAQLPHLEITAFDGHAKKEHKYSGVAVRELLNRVHVPLGEKLRGAALQTIVIARSRDGYAVVFALAEFDEAFRESTILLADREDDQPLRESAAPFQLIAPGDKRPARWARMVSTLEVTTLPKP